MDWFEIFQFWIVGEKVDPSRERRWSSQREHAPITAHTQEPPYLTSTNHQPYETNNWKQCFREPDYIHTTTNLTWLNQYIDGLLHEPPTIEDQCGNNVSENRHIYTTTNHCTWPQWTNSWFIEPSTLWNQCTYDVSEKQHTKYLHKLIQLHHTWPRPSSTCNHGKSVKN